MRTTYSTAIYRPQFRRQPETKQLSAKWKVSNMARMTTAMKTRNSRRLHYEVHEHEKSVGGSWWVASAVDDEGEGEIYCAEFTGPRAEELAVEYAEWKNGQC